MRKPLLFLLVVFCTASAQAASRLEEKLHELERTRAALSDARSKSEQIARNLDKMEEELSELAEEVTEVASSLQGYERDLTGLEERLGRLERERATKRASLARRRQQVAATLATLIRLGRVPKEAALLMPVNFVDKVRATRAIGLTTKGLRREMTTLTERLDELEALEDSIADERRAVGEKAETLRARQKSLRLVVSRRQEIMRALHGESLARQNAAAALANRSKDLQSLVESLEQAKGTETGAQFGGIGLPREKPAPPAPTVLARTSVPPAAGTKARAVATTLQPLPSFRAARGRLRLPVSGAITGRFGQKKGVNDTLKGVEIATRASAQVVAPFDGEVLFTGPFREYGNMVILRHSDNYHTLLAGLSELDCVPGQRLRAGEPLGLMGTANAARRLYLELRHAGKPTNPHPWLAGTPTGVAKN
jgi:septal ring factor EnvC (AmiA/AmiB activator)